MYTRRDIMKTTLAAGAAAVFAPAEFGHAAESKLTWKHFPAGANGFFRAPVLVSGPTEALLIDGGFSFSDGHSDIKKWLDPFTKQPVRFNDFMASGYPWRVPLPPSGRRDHQFIQERTLGPP